jgi:transposase-like protein
VNCIYCKSKDVVKNGSRQRNIIKKQSYFCNICKKQFVEPDGFERMRNTPEIISRAVHMHEDGFSLSKVQNHLWQHDGVKISRVAISLWIKKYAVFLKSAQQRSKTNN